MPRPDHPAGGAERRRALGITGHAYVIEQGRIVQSGRSADLAHDPAVIAHYLGQGDATTTRAMP